MASGEASKRGGWTVSSFARIEIRTVPNTNGEHPLHIHTTNIANESLFLDASTSSPGGKFRLISTSTLSTPTLAHTCAYMPER